jgi:hypothetical protein
VTFTAAELVAALDWKECGYADNSVILGEQTPYVGYRWFVQSSSGN